GSEPEGDSQHWTLHVDPQVEIARGMLDLKIAIAREACDGLAEVIAEPAKDLPRQVAIRAAADITIEGDKPGGLAVIERQYDAGGEDRIGPGESGGIRDGRQNQPTAGADIRTEGEDSGADHGVGLDRGCIDEAIATINREQECIQGRRGCPNDG